MADLVAATITQLKNIEAKTGKSIAELHAAIARGGASKHAEKRSWLMAESGLGYGDANTVVHFIDKPLPDFSSPATAAGSTTGAVVDPLEAIYSGAKAHLRSVHDAVIAVVSAFGPFEAAPKKAYVSLRRAKQFATVGPATKDSVQIGLNAKNLPSHARLKVQPPGGMCQATTRIKSATEIDGLLAKWLRLAYDAAG